MAAASQQHLGKKEVGKEFIKNIREKLQLKHVSPLTPTTSIEFLGRPSAWTTTTITRSATLSLTTTRFSSLGVFTSPTATHCQQQAKSSQQQQMIPPTYHCHQKMQRHTEQ
eukprot:2756190-Amphidinium_carterae.1